MRTSDAQLFNRLVRQFEGLRFTDEDLRQKHFHVGDPRSDARYMPGPPGPGVDLAGFEFFYEVPEVPNKERQEVLCMFGSHRHFHGAAFRFSDGSIRCIGRYCFQELAEHTGKDVSLVRGAVRHLTERQGHLRWFDRARGEVQKMVSQLSEAAFEARCKTHDQFFDRFRRANGPASKFAAKIAADHGRVLQYRQVTIKKTVMRETHVVELKNWQVFRGVIGVDRFRMELLEALREYAVALECDTNSLTATEFRQLRRKLDQLTDGLADLDRRLRSLVGFCQGDGLTHFVELWNAQAPAGFELAIIGDKLVSGAETIPTEIPLAA